MLFKLENESLLAFCWVNYHKKWSYYQVCNAGEVAFDGQGQEDDFLNVGGINIFRGDDEVDDDNSEGEDYNSSNDEGGAIEEPTLYVGKRIYLKGMIKRE